MSKLFKIFTLAVLNRCTFVFLSWNMYSVLVITIAVIVLNSCKHMVQETHIGGLKRNKLIWFHAYVKFDFLVEKPFQNSTICFMFQIKLTTHIKRAERKISLKNRENVPAVWFAASVANLIRAGSAKYWSNVELKLC